jgi:hypothetical protein
MRSIVKAFVVVVLVVGPSAVSLAMPIRNTGGTRCKCMCQAGSKSKELDWRKDKSCGSSNGESCKVTWDGGRTYTQGKLGSCTECRAGSTDTEWICDSTWLKSRVRPPAGTLQQKSPPKQQTSPSTPPATGTLEK